MIQTYTPPVSNLLSYRECQPLSAQGCEPWPNYIEELGLTKEHIPDLLTLMQDSFWLDFDVEAVPADMDDTIAPDLAMWGPIHAWRALGQLKAEAEFLEAAVTVLRNHPDMDWAWIEFPMVFQMLGPSTLEPLAGAISAYSSDYTVAGTLVESMTAIAMEFPEERDRCITLATNLLTLHVENHDSINAGLISLLIDLKAVESVETIAAAYEAKSVDEFYVGTWPYVQVELGLKTEADFTEAELTPEASPHIEEMWSMLQALEQMKKPSAFEKGLPLDPKAFTTTPPEFGDMVNHNSISAESKKGFGGTKNTGKKSKKKKKK